MAQTTEKIPSTTTPWLLAGIPCALIILGACMCLALGTLTYSLAGGLWQRIRDQFNPPAPGELTLSDALAGRGDASFRFSPCTLSNASGFWFNSSQAAPSGDLTQAQVEEHVRGYLAGEALTIIDRQAASASGAQVSANRLSDTDAALSLSWQGSAPGPTTRSLAGQVSGSSFQGRYDFSQEESLVEGGQAISRSQTISVDLTCTLVAGEL